MKRLLPLCGLLVSSLAAAQPMMDPAQVSGIPRPDPQVPGGTLTVKVVRGEIAAWAPVGTEVHLVGMRGDGTMSHVVVPLNDEGRAEFPELVRDGSTAYYALAVFGEDRLTSQPVLLPPKVGVRMMLSGSKKGAPAVDDEADDRGGAHKGAHDDAEPGPPPPGEVEIAVRGRAVKEGKVLLRGVDGGKATEAALTGQAEALAARFSAVTGAGPYVAEIAVGKKVYRSTPFMLSPRAGARRMILVYDDLLFAVQGGAQPDDGLMWFEMALTVANVSSAPIDGGPEGLILPLPLNHRSVKLADENSPFTIIDGGLRGRSPVSPGQLQGTVQFALPIVDGRVDVEMPAPYGMFQSQLVVLKTGSTVVSGITVGPSPRVSTGDDGRQFYVLEGFTVPPGEALRFTISGLPVPPKWQLWAKALAAVLVVGLVALAFIFAVRKPRRAASVRSGTTADNRRELGARREKLYAELVALERLRAAERIDGGDFAAQRRVIMAKLVLVHRELDELDGGVGGQAQAS